MTMIPTMWSPKDLLYSAGARCWCGAGLAYPRHDEEWFSSMKAWCCSAVLLGEVALPVERKHDFLEWWMYEVKSENQPSAAGRTTRPPEHGHVEWRLHATCDCGTKFESDLRRPGGPNPWAIQPCPGCGRKSIKDDGTSDLAVEVRAESVVCEGP